MTEKQPRRLQWRFPGLDAAAGRLPQQRAVVRVTPVQQEHVAARVHAQDPYRGPGVSDLHVATLETAHGGGKAPPPCSHASVTP